MKLIHVALATAMIAVPVCGFAQTTNQPQNVRPATHRVHTIAARKVRQQNRIAQGVRSGQLTPRETAHLERQEAGINKEERGMREQNNGRLTRQDRHTLVAQQKKESRRIFRDKHNNRTTRA